MLIGLTYLWLVIIGGLAWFDEKRRLVYLAMILPTYAVRLEILGIPTTWLELAIYILVIVWVIRCRERREKVEWWRPLQPYLWPLLLLAAGLIVGTIVSSDKLISLGIIKGWWIDPLLIFILITNSTTHKQFPERGFNDVVAGLWISGVAVALMALGQVVTGQFVTLDQRASAWFTSANYLSLYLVPIMLLVWGRWKDALGCWRWVMIAGWVMMATGLYFSASYAGWLALSVGLIVTWWLTMPSWKLLVGGVAGIILAISAQWQSPKFQQFLDLAGRSSSHVRLQVWQTAGLMIKEHWWAGIGLGLFEKRYLGFAERLFSSPLEPIMLHAHNFWLQAWLNLGLMGLIGFGLWLGQWFWNLWPQVRLGRPQVVAIFAAMVALLTHGLVDTPYWKNDLSALFWIIMALGALFIRKYGRKNLSDWY